LLSATKNFDLVAFIFTVKQCIASMRREGKFGLARTIRRCCAGRLHQNPDYAMTGPALWRRRAASESTLEQRRSVYRSLQYLGRAFEAWKKMTGVTGTDKWSSKANPWEANCCGGNSKGARLCLGHNYSHVARCGKCRYGDPTKSLKKQKGHQEKQRWQDIVKESMSYDARDCIDDLLPVTSQPSMVNKVGSRPHARKAAEAASPEHRQKQAAEAPPVEFDDWVLVDVKPPEWGLAENSWNLAAPEVAHLVAVPAVPPPHPAFSARGCIRGCACLSRKSRKMAKFRFVWS